MPFPLVLNHQASSMGCVRSPSEAGRACRMSLLTPVYLVELAHPSNWVPDHMAGPKSFGLHHWKEAMVVFVSRDYLILIFNSWRLLSYTGFYVLETDFLFCPNCDWNNGPIAFLIWINCRINIIGCFIIHFVSKIDLTGKKKKINNMAHKNTNLHKPDYHGKEIIQNS